VDLLLRPAYVTGRWEAGVNTSSSKTFFERVADFAKFLTLFGIPLYVVLWLVTSSFYSRLGVDPQEVGLDYASLLVRSCGRPVSYL
jgi:hypothetical protein